MRRAGPLALLPALLLAVPSALAETCSRSTLASPDFAFARWCGDPATTGTLRVARRDGRATDYLAVPADTYRELIRTHQVARFLSTEIEPKFRRAGAAATEAPRAQPDAARPARAEPPLPLPPVPPPR